MNALSVGMPVPLKSSHAAHEGRPTVIDDLAALSPLHGRIKTTSAVFLSLA
jgi:hypothetical protein